MSPVLNIPLNQIHDHPLNKQVFGQVDDGLLDSIEVVDIVQPLVVARMSANSYRLISGHRRKMAAQVAGMADVPCIVHTVTPDVMDIMWAEANNQREWTTEAKLRWVKYREKCLKLAKNKDETDGGQICPLERTREKVAKEVGISRRKADAGIAVVNAIDEAEAAGDTETATELRETLNKKSVNAAKNKVPKPKKSRKKQASEKNPAPIANSLITKHISVLARGIDDVAELCGWQRKSKRVGHHRSANDAINQLSGALKEMAKGNLE